MESYLNYEQPKRPRRAYPERPVYRNTAKSAAKSVARSTDNYRSAARKHYSKAQKTSDYRATFLMQCTICAVILAIVLFICIIHTPFTDGVRGQVKTALSTETHLDGLTGTASQGWLGNIQNAVKLFFGGVQGEDTPADTNDGAAAGDKSGEANQPADASGNTDTGGSNPEAVPAIIINTPAPASKQATPEPVVQSYVDGTRVDEDILADINKQAEKMTKKNELN